ncbi:MAG: YceD family protein [Acutalibacteraceae bacterium]
MIDLRPVFSDTVDKIDIDTEFDLSELEFSKNHPFKTPVKVKGKISKTAGAVELKAVAEYDYFAPCDRCAADVVRSCKTPISHIIVSELGNEDTEEFVLCEDMKLNLYGLVRDDIILEMPSKFLCREDCKGICPVCGKNLNEGGCGCKEDEIDPRLSALKQLLNK